jgi:hypothetical protein
LIPETGLVLYGIEIEGFSVFGHANIMQNQMFTSLINFYVYYQIVTYMAGNKRPSNPWKNIYNCEANCTKNMKKITHFQNRTVRDTAKSPGTEVKGNFL